MAEVFSSIAEVCEVSNLKQCNKLLREGWILLGVAKSDGFPAGDPPCFTYSLGKTQLNALSENT